MNKSSFRHLVVLCCVLVFMVTQSTFAVQAQDGRWAGRTIIGTAYFIGGFRPSQSRSFSLRINQLTSAADVQRLNETLRSGGQEELLSVLSKMNAGRIMNQYPIFPK